MHEWPMHDLAPTLAGENRPAAPSDFWHSDQDTVSPEETFNLLIGGACHKTGLQGAPLLAHSKGLVCLRGNQCISKPFNVMSLMAKTKLETVMRVVGTPSRTLNLASNIEIYMSHVCAELPMC